MKNSTKQIYKAFIFANLVLPVFFLASCEKKFLEEKPNNALVIPQTISELQALLDNYRFFVQNVGPSLNQAASDDFTISDVGLKSLQSYERDSYLWSKDLLMFSLEWEYPYRQILYTNVVLEGLQKIVPSDKEKDSYTSLKGMALFLRAQALYNLSQTFCEVYTPSNAQSSPGVPIPLSADVTKRYERGPLGQTYSQILEDLELSSTLLPQTTTYLTRPSKAAASALKARVFLSMQKYGDALREADNALSANSNLIDFNTLSTTSTRSFPLALTSGNKEIIYYSSLILNVFTTSTQNSVNSTLFAMYDVNDLRKAIFFNNRGNGIYTFKGSYSGDSYLFSGSATNEMFLIRAECRSRLGDLAGATADLNTLLVKRYKTGTYIPVTSISADEVLETILRERRKELLARGLRWGDLRRLNLDSRFSKSIQKTAEGVTYILPAGDPRYVFPIPLSELAYHNIAQNPR
ncbi:RagB/SusD family nutrient uptake outer membrane protein [Pedobacter roseus]|uniref:RagB/SusD family nutrient uptake outer membrane protein n=1 Tax=Pedobacter roseus TaxID=336820 RepID=A0A7G9QH88_9SPHI|nr:RagB/SusD family nutrient uptake outer membrane protein [Pedobacter roseus]QNN42713.1 RagB/SusD family nutrient uptake outer membrane protein [Pedobacter roseus]